MREEYVLQLHKGRQFKCTKGWGGRCHSGKRGGDEAFGVILIAIGCVYLLSSRCAGWTEMSCTCVLT